jgi:hypothetical protein
MKQIISFVILAGILILNTSQSFASLVYQKPEFRGRVIDAETKEPIEGAVVVVEYNKLTHGIENNISVTSAKETLTDKNGDFYFPSYTTIMGPLSEEHFASFIIYKPGYDSRRATIIGSTYYPSPVHEEIFFSKGIGVTGEFEGNKVTFGIVELPKAKTREERLRAMQTAPTDAPAGKRAEELPLLYKAINEERRRLGLEGEVE